VDEEPDVFDARAHFQREQTGRRQRVQGLRPVELDEGDGPMRFVKRGAMASLPNRRQARRQTGGVTAIGVDP
jgi:hypothetical protein